MTHISYNLPPGINIHDIPGSKPEDEEWERFYELVDDDCYLLKLTPEEAKEIWNYGKKILKGEKKN